MIKAHFIRNAIRAVVIAACLFCALSCLRETLEPLSGDPYLKLVVNVPGASPSTKAPVSGREDNDGRDNNGPTDQRMLHDVYALIFNADGSVLKYAVKMTLIDGENTDVYQTYGATLLVGETKVEVSMWILANMEQNGFSEESIYGLLGKSKDEVQSELVYAYDYALNEDGQTLTGWDLSEHCLPMWGEAYLTRGESTFTIDPTADDPEITVYGDLYRAVAKMGFSVNIDEDSSFGDFTLKEVYVYYANDRGAVIPDVDNVPTAAGQYTTPDVPSSAAAFSKENPIKYIVNGDDGIGSGEEWLNEIFLCESDNLNSETKLVVVVGGTLAPLGVSDADEMSYYRIDMATSEDGDFDIIRNHSYIINIRSVTNPGTSDPDPDRATDGLVVEIEDYVEEDMRGINTQYTLTVNQSAFSFNGQGSDLFNLEVDSENVDWQWDYGDKKIYYVFGDDVFYVISGESSMTVYNLDGDVVDDDSKIGYSDSGKYVYYIFTDDDGNTQHTLLNWMDIAEYPSNTNLHGQFDLVAEPNVNETSLAKSAYIYITAGSIKKKIQFVQNIGATANSVIITKAGDYYLNVTLRGNGNETDEEGDDISFNLGSTIDVTKIKYVQIIWETADNLVQIYDDEDYLQATGCIKFHVNDINLSQFGNWTGSVFKEHNGGNALIGAFDEEGTVLWSWHIWVIPDYTDGIKTEVWNTGYEFMDRNLGAYTNYPGSASFGLLYQWGRKDPFIGAYREDRQRDYHLVPKQYTKLYSHPVTGEQFEWVDFDDSVYGENDERDILTHDIQNPTQILDDGLLSEKHNITAAHGLWGTSSADPTETELGKKTMWDPCPDGYRVPTLNALTIEDGHNNMWYYSYDQQVGMASVEHAYYTSRYVPVKYGDSYACKDIYTASFVSDAPFYGFWLDYDGRYGFESTFELYNDTGYGVNYYYDDMTPAQLDACGWISPYSASNPGKPANVTWLPLSGIYNGTMDHFGRAGLTDRIGMGSAAPYLPASSLQVTSVLWGNSPTPYNESYPGGLLLHGTEGAYAPHYLSNDEMTTYQYSAGTYSGGPSEIATEGKGYWTTDDTGYSTTVSGYWAGTSEAGYWFGFGDFPTPTKDVSGDWVYDDDYWYDENGESGSGRHFHSFCEQEISTLANPSYAASIRCIVDKDALHVDSNKIYVDADLETEVEDTVLDLYQNEITEDHSGREFGRSDYEIDIFVYSLESWQVSNPGARWISVSPVSGNSTGESGKVDTLVIKYNTSATEPSVGDKAVISVKFLSGVTITVTVQYAGESLINYV